MRPRIVLAVVLVAALAERAAADPIIHIKSPSEVTTAKGSKLSLPPGYFLDEPTWADRDAKFRKAEDDRTRLAAENDSLRKSAQSMNYGTIACAVGFGILAGFVLVHSVQ